MRVEGKTSLYRHWGAGGELLYIGISLSAVARLSQHRKSRWADKIANVTIEYHANRSLAELAERLAIRREKPLHNIAHTQAAANDNEPEEFQALDCTDYPKNVVQELPPLPDGDEYVRGMSCARMLVGYDIPLPSPDFRRVHASGKMTGNYWLRSALESYCARSGRKPYEWLDSMKSNKAA